MNDKIPKYHAPAYEFLKRIATKLAVDFNHSVCMNYSTSTRKSVRRNCMRVWDAAIQKAVSPGGKINATQGDIDAAMKRLRFKGLVPFLERGTAIGVTQKAA